MPVQEFTPEELETEEWRDVVGYERLYQVSSLGRVKRISIGQNCHRLRLECLKPAIRKDGYPFVLLLRGTKASTKNRKLHTIVAEAFLGTRPAGKEVNHIDADRQNSKLSNLEYVTHKQNMEQASRLGNMSGRRGPNPNQQGEKSPSAKLTSLDVVSIRRSILAGVKGIVIARDFNVTPMAIAMIKTGKSWGHLQELRDEVKALGSWKTARRGL